MKKEPEDQAVDPLDVLRAIAGRSGMTSREICAAAAINYDKNFKKRDKRLAEEVLVGYVVRIKQKRMGKKVNCWYIHPKWRGVSDAGIIRQWKMENGRGIDLITEVKK